MATYVGHSAHPHPEQAEKFTVAVGVLPPQPVHCACVPLSRFKLPAGKKDFAFF